MASTLLDGVPITTPPHLWYYVIRRFNRLLSNVDISPAQREDGTTKWQGINSTLNRRYWGHNSETLNGILIGSWGKRTQTAPPRDVDLLFLLPADVYHRFQQRTGNQQSQLLQEIKEALAVTYPQTKMRADGQVVVVPFNTIEVEVAPGFRCDDGSIIVCDANNNGRYITSTSEAEISDIESWDTALHGNTGALIKMGKRWQHECNVPLKSFHIERLAIEFLTSWPYRLQGVFYYDWMVRDFFAHIIGRANGVLSMPGTGETVWLGDEWLSRAQSAFRNATSAAENERDNYEVLAGEDWQKIFGTAAPRTVS